MVKGDGFGKGKRVVLTVSASSAQRMRGLTALRNGSFIARFDLRLGRCAALTIRAVGARGSRAILQVEPGCTKKRRERD